ncbi:tubulin beta chain-like [Polypterus senegalus]|nr:tubulin beta chain-like [Polypterus senegalus]XP_039593062.1 tubulin beta chain-like [Polypterus senegalus]XP_039593063.1 tubulin beta chain-like [Polypterus senegalus]
MSAVWLHVGQCGNQIGQEWWRLIADRAGPNCPSDRHPFVSSDGKLAAICVDSEPKVVRKGQTQVKNGCFRDSNLIFEKEGCGSNWAYGYHGPPSQKESGLRQRAMESLRKEIERRDCYSGTVLFHSLSGGTGAGLGARLCEDIRDEYPVGYILTVSVAPHKAGESPLQHYNNLLCLSALQRSADGVLLVCNDQVMNQVLSPLNRGGAISTSHQPQASMSVMNTHITSCLAGLLYPVRSLRTGSGISLGLEPWELIRSVCPVPAAKFLQSSQASTRGVIPWESLASSTLKAVPRHSSSGTSYCSTAVLAVARGDQSGSFQHNLNHVLQKLKQGHRCPSWNPFPIDYWTDPQDVVNASPSSHSLTVCSNHSSVVDFLQQVNERAQEMFKAGAYLHWYRRYSCEDLEFLQAFETVDGIIAEYVKQG